MLGDQKTSSHHGDSNHSSLLGVAWYWGGICKRLLAFPAIEASISSDFEVNNPSEVEKLWDFQNAFNVLYAMH